MTSKQHILVVDDDPIIRQVLDHYLTRRGYRVSVAGDGKEMDRLIEREGVDVVILDIGLPGEDGLSIARRLRVTSNVGIMMLTGNDEPVDRVVGLEVGADDYVTKPFDNRELLARLRSLLRRLAMTPPQSAQGGRTAVFSGWMLDLGGHELTSKCGDRVPLTTAEFKLLAAFVTHANRVLTRDQLLDLVANRGWDPSDRSIDILVSKVRRSIEPDPRQPTIIKSIRGVGYKFVAGVEFR